MLEQAETINEKYLYDFVMEPCQNHREKYLRTFEKYLYGFVMLEQAETINEKCSYGFQMLEPC